MKPARPPVSIDAVVERLRAHILAREPGTFLGKEEALQHMVATSLPTLRQAARIVEREGLLIVKRGPSGGYFCAEPDRGFIEAAVGNYLQRLEVEQADLAAIATVLWIEVVRKASSAPPEHSRALVKRFEKKLGKLTGATEWREVVALDLAIRTAIFELIRSPYVELIFNVNSNLATRAGGGIVAARDITPEHARFVEAWRKAKLIELAAIADGETRIAIAAARRAREVFVERVWSTGRVDG